MVTMLLAAVLGLARPAAFERAVPVWPAGEETAMNTFFRFRCEFDASEGTVLRVSAGYDYRAKLNGEFVGFGPARAAHGYARVDEWPLTTKAGRNVLEIESAGYNCNSYYLIKQTPFVVAEVVSGGKVVAATGKNGDFSAYETDRIRKAPRFAYQRTFMDAYRPGKALRTEPHALAEIAAPSWIERGVDCPDFAVVQTKPLRRGVWAKGAARKFAEARFITNSCGNLDLFPMDELETNPYYELQGYHTEKRVPIEPGQRASCPLQDHTLSALESLVTTAGRVEAGFVGLRVKTKGPCRVLVTFDEILTKEGDVDFTRLDCGAVCEWRIEKAGEYELESFEPYGSQYFETIVLEGEAEVSAPWVRTFKSPTPDRATFASSDPGLDKVFYAARESLKANSVDAFTDCPAREHACWSGDTFFTSRAAHLLNGDARVEKAFFANFLMPERFDWSKFNPLASFKQSTNRRFDDSMISLALPALYPGDIYRGNFIPVFMLWDILQFKGYFDRTGDRAFADAAKKRLLGVLEFLDVFRNSDGLLEKLPGWIVIEWSEANKFGQDVSYIINMMYAAAKAACGEMYGIAALTDEAAKIRREIIRQSWNGEWFRDHSVRGKDGRLVTPDDISETCQYSAFYFGLVTPEERPVLWKRLLDDFGPERKTNGKWKKIWPSNLLFGTCMRMDLLSRDGRSAQVLSEARGWFLGMAELTGTLWEYLSTYASCCHGFPSIAAVHVCRDALGVRSIDYIGKKVVFRPDPSVPLDWCKGTLPLSRTEVGSFEWRREGGRIVSDVKLPVGWTQDGEAPRWLSVMPLVGDAAVLAEDVATTARTTPIDAIAYSCTLVPEGAMPVDKASDCARKYRTMSAEVRKLSPVRQGILFQATMGHGWTPQERTPWQMVVDAKGEAGRYKFCPLDERFLEFMADQARKLAETDPDFFMVDDDTRLITGVDGCFCPLHLAEFERRTGRAWTREQILSARQENPRIAADWDALLRDSIAGLLTRIRAAFPKTTPGLFCCCLRDAHHAGHLARILAAEGQTPVVRLNNAEYLCDNLIQTLRTCSATSRELADIGEGVIVLDEPDTCPQNRYSTSATRFISHMLVSSFIGCDGAKIWITRLGNPHERESGAAYRAALARQRGLIERVAALHVREDGVVVPLPEKRPLNRPLTGSPFDWGTAFLGRMGIPYRTGKVRKGDVAFLTENDVDLFSDAELTNILSGAAILDGKAAIRLTERGFSELTGVNARDWSGETISAEDFGCDGLQNGTVNGAADLTDRQPSAKVHSTFIHKLGKSQKPLGPGSVQYGNRLGGQVIVLGPFLPAGPSLMRYAYYTESRKRHTVRMIRTLASSQMPGGVFYPGDAPVLCKTGIGADGSRIVMLDVLDLDSLEKLPLVFDREPTRLERLGDDGVWRDVPFRTTGVHACEVETRLETLRPAFLRVTVGNVATADSHVQSVIAEIRANVEKLKAASPAARPMAFWDFDGTIIKGDCSEGLVEGGRVLFRGLVEETIRAGLCPVYAGEAGWRQYADVDYPRMNEIGRWFAWPYNAQIYAGVETARLDEFCARKFREVYSNWYFVSSLEMLGELERMGVENYIVSASPEIFVRNAAETVGLSRDRVAAIRVEIDGGRMTTHVVHPVPAGEGKVENVRRLVLARPNGVAVAGFGNSYSTDGAFLKYIADQRLPGGVKGVSVMINGGTPKPGYEGCFRLVRQERVRGKSGEF